MPAEAKIWHTFASGEDAPLLSPVEDEFIRTSLEHADSEKLAAAKRLRSLRKRKNAAVLAAVVALAMFVAASIALLRIDHYRHVAEATTVEAQSKQIALIADELRPTTPNTAGQLAAAAFSMDQSVQTRSAVLKSGGAPMPTRVTGPTGNAMVGYSQEHGIILRGDSQGIITIWRDSKLLATPEAVASGGNQLFALEVADVGGRALVFVGGQQTAGVWDVTEAPVKLGEFGEDTVAYSVAWQDGVVHFGTLEGEVRRVDMTGPEAVVLKPLSIGDKLSVTALEVTDRWIVAGGRKNRLELFTVAGERHGHLPMVGTALHIYGSADGSELLVASAGSQMTLWSVGGGSPDNRLIVDNGSVPELVGTVELPGAVHSVLHLGDRLLAAGVFGEIREYDRSFQLRGAYPERSVVVSMAEVNGEVLAGGTGGTTTLWDPAGDTTILTAPEGVTTHDITHGGDVLLIGTSAGGRVVTDNPDGSWTELSVEPAPDGSGYTYYYAISSDGSVVANQTGAGDLVTLQRQDDSYVVVDVMPDQAKIVDLRISPDGRMLALGYRGQGGYHLLERDGTGWTEVIEVHSWPAGCAFSPDGKYFAAMNYDGNGATIWDITTPVPVHVAELVLDAETTPSAFSFSSDGNLAIGDNRGEISVYSMANPERPALVHQLRDARSSLAQVAYSTDGDRLLAATREGQLWVWQKSDDSATLDLQLTPGTGAVMGSAWFRDKVVMAVSDGRVVAWPGHPEDAVAELCSRFGEPLGLEEWSRLVPGVELTSGC